MKKLSLLLALLLVVSCFVLASCGEEEESSVTETSSTATSSAESKEESKAESSEAASSEEESSEEESKEPEYTKNPDALATEGNNVAAGKTYEISEQFRAGGADVGWGWDENAPISYPDNNYELTDGYVPTGDDKYSADCWMALTQNTPSQTERGYGYIKIDLGEIYEISSVSLACLKDSGTGIACPRNVEIMISEDGENWYSATNLDFTSELDGMDDLTVHNISAEVDVTARYVEIRLISYGWVFMGELEIK